MLVKITNLNPSRVHDGGGCVGDGIDDRGLNKNLLNSYTGNNMRRVTVKQIFCNGRFARTVWK